MLCIYRLTIIYTVVSLVVSLIHTCRDIDIYILILIHKLAYADEI